MDIWLSENALPGVFSIAYFALDLAKAMLEIFFVCQQGFV